MSVSLCVGLCGSVCVCVCVSAAVRTGDHTLTSTGLSLCVSSSVMSGECCGSLLLLLLLCASSHLTHSSLLVVSHPGLCLFVPDQVKELVSKCLQARDMAYCPYSRFPVGAAILTADGAIITGNNQQVSTPLNSWWYTYTFSGTFILHSISS